MKLLIFPPSIIVNYSLITARFDYYIENLFNLNFCTVEEKNYDSNYMALR